MINYHAMKDIIAQWPNMSVSVYSKENVTEVIQL